MAYYYDRPPYYQPYYERDSQTYYNAVNEPYFDDIYRRDFRRGCHDDGRHGVVPMEEIFRRAEAPPWMNTQYQHGGQDGYRVQRHNHYGGQSGYRTHQYDHDDRHGIYRDTRHRSITTVELYVPICCDKCERKLRKHLNVLEGVESITADQTTKKVVVIGNVNPEHVLRRAQQDKPESEFWHSRYRSLLTY